MQLAIDIGNSNVVVGFYKEDNWLYIKRFPTLIEESPAWFYRVRLTDFMLENNIPISSVEKIVVSSVVPELTDVFMALSERVFQLDAIKIGPMVYPRLKLKIRNPYEIGTDLVANAAAAYQLYARNCIIIDFGTALTFTVLTAKGEILGVSIAPGLKTAISALSQKTAQLPPEVALQLPESAIGKDTVHAIQSGILIGYEGLVRHMIATIRKEVGQDYFTVATGGLSGVLTNLKEDFDAINQNLTLDGLMIIASVAG